MVSIEVAELTSQELDQWDSYVRNAAPGHPFQLSAWRQIMDECYGHRSWYLFAHEQDRIVGVLPLFEVRSRLLGTSITSLPGGLGVDSNDAATALLERATEITRGSRATCLTIRDSPVPWPATQEWQSCSSVSVLKLPGDYETLREQLKRQVWQHVKKAQSCGVETYAGPPDLDDFYPSLCRLFREKGVPVFGRDFFEALIRALPGQVIMTMARREGEVLGGILHVTMGGTIFSLWGGAPSRYLELHASHALWWASICYGVEHGYRSLDMGRSPRESGLEQFKARWGAVARPVYRFQCGMRGKVTYEPTQDTDGMGRYQIFVRVWRRLPSALTCFLGPKLRRHMPFA